MVLSYGWLRSEDAELRCRSAYEERLPLLDREVLLPRQQGLVENNALRCRVLAARTNQMSSSFFSVIKRDWLWASTQYQGLHKPITYRARIFIRQLVGLGTTGILGSAFIHSVNLTYG